MYIAEPIPQNRTVPFVTTIAVHVLFIAGLALTVGVVKILPEQVHEITDIPLPHPPIEPSESLVPNSSALTPSHAVPFTVHPPVFTIGDNEDLPPGEGAIIPTAHVDPPAAPMLKQVRLLASTDPIYPSASRRGGEEGVVFVRATITPFGTIGELAIEKSSGFARLDEAALNAVQQWRFAPAMRGTQAVAGVVVVPVRFQIQGR